VRRGQDDRAEKISTFEELDEITREYEVTNEETAKQNPSSTPIQKKRRSLTKEGVPVLRRNQKRKMEKVTERMPWKSF